MEISNPSLGLEVIVEPNRSPEGFLANLRRISSRETLDLVLFTTEAEANEWGSRAVKGWVD